MTRLASEKETPLGTMEIEIAGPQYHEATAQSGEQVHLEREPRNAHDSNALRIENAAFEPIGYIPRKHAAWLAPLIDAGKIQADGTIPEEPAKPNTVSLDLYVCPKGASILSPIDNPAGAREALHQTVLQAFRSAGQWTEPEAIGGLATVLKGLPRREMDPETLMLLHLFEDRVQDARKRSSDSAADGVRAALAAIRIGAPLHYQDLTLFPLFVPDDRQPPYLLLTDALATGQAEVRETSASGQVPELLVENRSDRPILIPEGEILTGAKQNRVVNVSVIVPPHSVFTLAVTCVEQGRWSHESKGMRASHYAPPGMRARKSASVFDRRMRGEAPHSDQSAVWEDVSYCLQSAQAKSRTESLVDGYTARKSDVDVYRKHLRLPENAAGVASALGNRLFIDLFDGSQTFSRLWPRMSEALFFQAATEALTPVCYEEESQIREILDGLGQNARPVKNPVGAGVELSLMAPNFKGSALWFNGCLCHLLAYPDINVLY